jgi:hypothetical protein
MFRPMRSKKNNCCQALTVAKSKALWALLQITATCSLCYCSTSRLAREAGAMQASASSAPRKLAAEVACAATIMQCSHAEPHSALRRAELFQW